MKKLVFYLLLILAIPATAQTGLFGSHSKPSSHATARPHNPGPLINVEHHKHHTPSVAKGMNPKDYDDAVKMINKEVFDEKRLNTAKLIITNNPMTTRQIANICKLFTFEANKLEFAKIAYRSCVDKGMYFLLDEVFTFSSSKDELHDFISRY